MGEARGEGSKRTLVQQVCSSSSTAPPPPPAAAAAALTSREEEVISKAVSFVKHLRRKSKWKEVRRLYPKGVPPSHSSQITLLLRNTPRLAIRFFHWARTSTPHTLLSFSAVIHISARARLRSHTISLATLALRSSCSSHPHRPPPLFSALASTYRTYHSSPFVFDWLILACLRSRLPHHALSILTSLRRNSIPPLLSTLSVLIRHFSRSLGATAGFHVFKEIFKKEGGEGGVPRPDLGIFHGMMASFGEEGGVEGVEMVMEEMRRRGFESEAEGGYSRSLLIAAYCEAGRMEEAERLLEEEEKPDVVACNCLIGGFFKRGEVDKGVGLFERMGRRGVEGNRVTYHKLINGYCHVSDMRSAMVVFEEMRVKGFVPNGSTVEAVIVGFCETMEVCRALDFFEMAVKRLGYSGSQRAYLVLMKGLLKEGRVRDAVKLKEEMVEMGLPLSPHHIRTLFSDYHHLGNQFLFWSDKKDVVIC